MDLYSPVKLLAGIGDFRAKQLDRLGIRTLYDLISFFPRAYEDRTKMVKICDMEVDVPACFRATVISYPRTSHIRKGMDITKLTVSDNTARLNLTYFNQPYVKDQLQYGCDYVFFGTLKDGFGLSLQNPQFDAIQSVGKNTGRILPIYPLTAGISNKILISCVRQAMDACLDDLPEILPENIRYQYDLCDAKFAYQTIHHPKNFSDLEKARRRLIFDEFFIFSAGLSLLRSRRCVVKTEPWPQAELDSFRKALPYTLTDAQEKTINHILQDVSSDVPMNRLIQGDVGSGKTIVAAAAAYAAFQAGKQAALMVPTEILAEQHFASLSRLLGSLGMEVVLLTGSLSAAEKKWIKQRIASGGAKLVIGTHALLTGNVIFSDLGLVVTDEQHRFGVAQRAALADKAKRPHMLFLSATPIPRTLGLILYGDLDVSIMDELPPGRQTIDTFLVNESMRGRITNFIRRHVENGNQVYVVCPAVEENPDLKLKSAIVWAEHLQKDVFPDLKIGLIHGKMSGSVKDSVMRSFAAGEINILVATTVIEVGVDVPNTTLIVIEDADRFGLSQLHQLRGRVGRGKDKSYCVLMTQNNKEETLSRLKALCSTNDGFKIAEQDLALRGPGDFFSNRQHGLPQFKVANLEMDLKTLHEAQEATSILSTEALEHDAAFAPLLARIQALFSEIGTSLN